jgi:hypothetical protein
VRQVRPTDITDMICSGTSVALPLPHYTNAQQSCSQKKRMLCHTLLSEKKTRATLISTTMTGVADSPSSSAFIKA